MGMDAGLGLYSSHAYFMANIEQADEMIVLRSDVI